MQDKLIIRLFKATTSQCSKVCIISCLAITLLSCQPDIICRIETDVDLGVGCNWKQWDATYLRWNTISKWDSVTVRGIGSDSAKYANEKDLENIYLPLRSDTDWTEYLIEWHNKKDTLKIHHQNIQRYISMACVCIVFHSIDTIEATNHFIDTLNIISTEVQNYKTRHLLLLLDDK